MAHIAITIEGGLISGDLLEQLATDPEKVDGQRPADFRVERRLSEEIQGAFSDATTYWHAFEARMNRGKERSTTITRETWMMPLLEELGYSLEIRRAKLIVGDHSYGISHRYGQDESAPPVHIVAADQDLDKRGDAKQSPHAIVQEYLNRSDALWGIVTNGRQLRLLRNTARFSKPTYIEFDLDAMMAGGLYSEFILFYRLVHATRFPTNADDAHICLIERYHQQGIEAGGRVREKLRDGVREALEILGTGFLAHAESESFRQKFTGKAVEDVGYYRQLLRLIYRLLFLMVAEERRLLFVNAPDQAQRQDVYTGWYSTARLRERAEARTFDDDESDLWDGLKQTFRLFEDAATAAKLGLSALDGELFGRFACQDLVDTQQLAGPRLRNAALLDAIWHLSTFEDSEGRRKRGSRRRVNFAGLDVEELGSVYEALLDYHPEVTLDGERSRFDLVAGSERKSTGSYYTPPELVAELIKSALDPVIANRLAGASTREQKEQALLSLKVCDPASGSGHFMLAAARRIGRELARVRSGEAEPNPTDYRRAVRDVIRRCIYAVDKNPLAVDLCKVALWIEAHAAGMPLSFLDNHVKCGDSLIGVLDLAALGDGVPDGAYKPVTGDDKAIASELRKRNKAEAKEISLFRHDVSGEIGRIAGAFAAVADLPETTPDEVHTKEARYISLRDGSDWKKVKAACDLWTAAFFVPLSAETKPAAPTTRNVWDAIAGRLLQGRVTALVTALVEDELFFHWPLEFPEVFAVGGASESGSAKAGFDVMLGNPPWERIKLQEREFFATRDRAIADAPNKAARDRLIKALYTSDASSEKRLLGEEWQRAKHGSECQGIFVRESGRYPLTATGDINTYAIFAETFLRATRVEGRTGLIVPTGIATDTTTKDFFGYLMSERRLVSLYDFENREGIFPGIDSRMKFSLVTLGRADGTASFAFFLTRTEQLADERRRFTLTEEDIALINPNTHTAPIFRSQADAELTKGIYRRVPVLVDEGAGEANNPWRIEFMTMFHMANDSGLFRNSRDLSDGRAESIGEVARELGLLPLYEAKNDSPVRPSVGHV
jgi:hypothetical protein